MSIQTVDVTTTLCYPNGEPAKDVRVVADLISPVQSSAGGYIVQRQVRTVVDENGIATLSLWPNESGCGNSFYNIQAYDEILGELLKVVAVVPESTIPVELEDISMSISGFNLGCSSGTVVGIRRIDTEEGIAGGGDLTTNRTHCLDLSTISTQELEPPGSWVIAVQDPTSPKSVRWARLADLPGLGTDTIEFGTATVGQTVIFIEEKFSPNSNALDVYIDGVHQCPTKYVESAVVDNDPYTGKIQLLEPLEGGEEICIKIKKNAPFASGIDASQVLYSGGGTVEDALDTLFSTTGASPWQSITADYITTAGDRLFVSTNTGSVNITLPSSPNVGDTITIIDITSSAFTGPGNSLNNDFTILRNGNLIMELTEDLIVDQAKVSLEFIYSGASIGWIFSE